MEYIQPVLFTVHINLPRRNANILLFMAEAVYLSLGTCEALFPCLLYYLII